MTRTNSLDSETITRENTINDEPDVVAYSDNSIMTFGDDSWSVYSYGGGTDAIRTNALSAENVTRS